ncbi:MAG: phenylacetic acid degradation protein PaaN [Gammaproteobacteria bacterium]|nr:phenylacetic acid degradation protein PaaN [Gammaproteobacteria bacterium]
MNLIQKHKDTLDRAYQACNERSNWSGFIASPSKKLHPAGAPEMGKAAFEAMLGQPFKLDQPAELGRIGEEVSPYTQLALGIDYPQSQPELLCRSALRAMRSWRSTDPDSRAAVSIELLKSIEASCFESLYATMHTTGQSYMMSFVGSGANALDRGLEAIVYAHKAMTDIPAQATWRKRFGDQDLVLEKRFHYVPRGIALVICCASFPAWNAYPAITANIMTGNPVILKPHPHAVLPMAIAVRNMRATLSNNGFDPNLVTLATDTMQSPIAGQYFDLPEVAIVDFTGSQRFGSWIENNVRDKLIFTETSGVNSVVIESTENLDGMLDAIAHSLCLFSAQMCTSVQNIHVPRDGIDTDQGHIGAKSLSEALVAAVDRKLANPQTAAATCATIQSANTIADLATLQAKSGESLNILRASKSYPHPDFADARTATPLMIEVNDSANPIIQQEHFGPVSFVVMHESAEAALSKAASDAKQFGAIATHVYSANREFMDLAEVELIDAGASFSCNLTGAMPLNFAAAYSDLHVTGLNPAGNACLTDLSFIANRFRIAQCRWPAGSR